MASSTFTSLCHRHLYLVPKQSHPPKRRPPFPLNGHSGPRPQPLENGTALSFSLDVPVLGWTFPRQWGHTTCGLRCPASLTQHHALTVHPGWSRCQSSIPLHGRVILHWMGGCLYLQLSCFRSGSPGNQGAPGKCLSPVLSCRIPVHTIFDSCPKGHGIRAIAITHDAKYLATISDAEIQVQGPVGWPQRAGRPVQRVPRSRLLGPRGIRATLGTTRPPACCQRLCAHSRLCSRCRAQLPQ